MEKRNLGRTGLAVTAMGYGAMELRQAGIDQQAATRLLNTVLDSGINYIDTSPDYGLSETYIGQAIAHRRDEYYLATKCGCHVDQHGKSLDPGHVWSRDQLQHNIENSLRLLNTDTIDVWQLHGVYPGELAGGKHDDVIKTMQQFKQQGKVRVIGLSFRNGRPGEELYPAGFGYRDLKEFMSWGVFDVMQTVYGGLTRLNEIVIAQAAQEGVGMIIRGVVKNYEENYAALFAQTNLQELCDPGETQSSFLIRFALNHPGLSTMIIGSKNVDHIAANVRAVQKGKLPDDVYEEAKRRLDAAGIVAGGSYQL
jgi:aryl-alcohol dehydrogenase-like predicted oxidoreductase